MARTRSFRLGGGGNNQPSDDEQQQPPEETVGPPTDTIVNDKPVEAVPTRRKPRRIIKAQTSVSDRNKSNKIVADNLAMLAGFACGAAAFATKHDFWAIDEREATELGKAIASAVPQLPDKQIAALEERLPALNLLLVSGQIFLPKIIMEMEIRRGDYSRWQMSEAQQNANGLRHAPTADQPDPNSPVPPMPNRSNGVSAGTVDLNINGKTVESQSTFNPDIAPSGPANHNPNAPDFQIGSTFSADIAPHDVAHDNNHVQAKFEIPGYNV